MYPTLRRKVLRLRFKGAPDRIGAAEFKYQCEGSKEPRRFVAIRRPLPEDPTEAAQLMLLKDRRYACQAMVTNLTLEPYRLWSFYVQRANCGFA
jgi:hypothetical protein